MTPQHLKQIYYIVTAFGNQSSGLCQNKASLTLIRCDGLRKSFKKKQKKTAEKLQAPFDREVFNLKGIVQLFLWDSVQT